MSKSIILNCTCENKFQDELYGKGKRAHNIDSTQTKASCTVCEGSAKYNKRNSKSTPPTTNRPSKQIR